MKVFIFTSSVMGIIKFRKELIEKLIEQGYEVTICGPDDKVYVPQLIKLNTCFIETKIHRRGKNIITDGKLLKQYLQIIKEHSPNLVITYTIKPNIYGGLACRISKTPYISNVTGLGNTGIGTSLMKNLIMRMYRVGLKKAKYVFFQNKSNMKIFEEYKIINKNALLVAGSGVNLKKFDFLPYPQENEKIRILFIGRLMKEKGLNELLEAITIIKNKRPLVQFDIIGSFEENYRDIIEKYEKSNKLNFYGEQKNIIPYLKRSNAIINPSYHEGLSNVLLEAAAVGRPILASDIPGCRETFIESITGFGFEPRNTKSLVNTIDKFIKLEHSEKQHMGQKGRQKVVAEFNRDKVVAEYISIIKSILEEK